MTVQQILKQELQFPVVPAASNDLLSRLGAVDDFLMQLTEAGPALVLDPSCKVLARALAGGYRYAISSKGDRAPKPDKNDFSHPADALQYLCMGFRQYTASARRRQIQVPRQSANNSYVW